MSFQGKTGLFEYRDEKGAAPKTTNYVTGYLQRLWLEWDPGHVGPTEKSSVPPRWELVIELDSPEYSLVKLDVGPAATVYILGAQLLQVRKGEFVGITLRAGTDATLTDCATWDGKGWKHRYPPKKGDASTIERYEAVLVALQGHEAWDKPAEPRRKDIVEPVLPQARPGEQTAGNGEAAVQTSGRMTQPNPATQGAMAAQAPAGSGIDAPKTVFGHPIARPPKPESWTRPLNAAIVDQIAKLKADKIVSQEDQHLLAAVGDVYGRPQGAISQNFAEGLLLYEVLTAGNHESLLKLREAAIALKGATKEPTSTPEEYDPFADE
jgi:hypothetical protein